jgi:hypothetical protein
VPDKWRELLEVFSLTRKLKESIVAKFRVLKFVDVFYDHLFVVFHRVGRKAARVETIRALGTLEGLTSYV